MSIDNHGSDFKFLLFLVVDSEFARDSERTATGSQSETPNFTNTDNDSLFQSAAVRHDHWQAALKELVCIDLPPTVPLNVVMV
jgi:hypothetical protein